MKQELSETLDRLHRELHSAAPLDDASKKALNDILKDIQGVLGGASDAQSSTHNLAAPEDSFSQISHRWQAIVDEFELKHPQLTSIVSQITERLTDMGI